MLDFFLGFFLGFPAGMFVLYRWALWTQQKQIKENQEAVDAHIVSLNNEKGGE